MTKAKYFLSLVSLSIATLVAISASSQSSTDLISYTRLYSDSLGITHFVDEQISATVANDDGALTTPLESAESVGYLLLPVGYDQDWHPAPRRQWIFILSGNGEIEASDGEIRELSGGSIIFVEDVTGKGHKTRNVGSETMIMAWVPVDSE